MSKSDKCSFNSVKQHVRERIKNGEVRIHLVVVLLLGMEERFHSRNQSDRDDQGDEQCVIMVEELYKRNAMVDQNNPYHEESDLYSNNITDPLHKQEAAHNRSHMYYIRAASNIANGAAQNNGRL